MDDPLRLEAGKLLLFKRNGLWQARISIGNRKYLWKSLKTSNAAEAKRAARKLFHQTEYKLDEGLPVQSRSFSDVIDEYITERENDNKIGKDAKRGSSIKHTGDSMLRQIKRVSKFWKEYAGKRAVDAIDDRVLRDFIPWRKTYYHKRDDIHHNAKLDPADKTLQWEMMLAKMILKYAKDQNYLGNKPLPAFTFTAKHMLVRPAFTPDEFKKVRNGLRKWIDETDNEHWKASRWLLHDYALTMGMSGLRPNEINNLKVRDYEIYQEGRNHNIRITVGVGKTGKRMVLPHHDLMQIFEDKAHRELQKKADDWLFTMPDGGKIITLIDQFNAFISHIKLTHNSADEKYTLYSLRHYYAVRSLERTDVYDVARNMGTSVQMIEKHYGKHSITPERARKLSGYGVEAERPYDPVVYERKPKPKRTAKR